MSSLAWTLMFAATQEVSVKKETLAGKLQAVAANTALSEVFVVWLVSAQTGGATMTPNSELLSNLSTGLLIYRADLHAVA